MSVLVEEGGQQTIYAVGSGPCTRKGDIVAVTHNGRTYTVKDEYRDASIYIRVLHHTHVPKHF